MKILTIFMDLQCLREPQISPIQNAKLTKYAIFCAIFYTENRLICSMFLNRLSALELRNFLGFEKSKYLNRKIISDSKYKKSKPIIAVGQVGTHILAIP